MLISHLTGSSSQELTSSRLYDESTFYSALLKDIKKCKKELIIESPFITHRRLSQLLPEFKKLTKRKVRIVINTKPIAEVEGVFRYEVQDAIDALLEIGVQVLFTGGHHRKLVIVDRKILYEGSLNILSQNDSCEIMRRMQSTRLAEQMIRFVRLKQFLDQRS